jgi:hypothetical protein
VQLTLFSSVMCVLLAAQTPHTFFFVSECLFLFPSAAAL